MSTRVVRVPERVQQEVATASHVLGVSSADLLERAWAIFRTSSEFKEEFYSDQRALAAGDLESVVTALDHSAHDRAEALAANANRV